MRNLKPDKARDLKIRSFRAAKLALKIIDLLPNKKAYWSLSDQFLRSITSVGANIIEAQAASSKKDFTNFYNHALKSANESKFWIALIMESGKIKEKSDLKNLLKEVTEISNILAVIILKLKGKR